LRMAPHFQQSQVLIRIFSEPQAMFFQTDRFSIFVSSQVNSRRQISIFKDFSKRDSRITNRFNKYPPRRGASAGTIGRAHKTSFFP